VLGARRASARPSLLCPRFVVYKHTLLYLHGNM